MKKYLLLATASIFIASPALADETVSFVNNAGKQVGTATLAETAEGVRVTLDLHDIGPGEHAIHFHEKAECSPPATFDNAGAHYNPDNKEHGKMSEHGPHAGDMDNVEAVDGVLKTSFVNPHVTLSKDAKDGRAPLLDADGSALILHGGEDDYKTQPSGNAGSRFACAEIR